MTVSAVRVQELRKITGAGMMDCKEALKETDGCFDEAIQWLKKKGLAKADRKTGRATADGLIGALTSNHEGVLVEVNSETDFVARNEVFQTLVRNVASVALSCKGDITRIRDAQYPETPRNVQETIHDSIATIGENITFHRSSYLSVENGVVVAYVHNSLADNLGKIGVLVGIETKGNQEAARAFARQAAMHVAAANPLALTVEGLDPVVVSKEREVFADQARQSGKPENIIEKMVEGRIRKFYEEAVFVHQKFVINNDITVEEALKNAEKEIGAPAKFSGFVRFALGEGCSPDVND